MSTEAKKYRPWPKKANPTPEGGFRRVLDKDKIKQLYLDQENFSWDGFCSAYNFKPTPYKIRQEFNFKNWQTEWLFKRMGDQDEAALATAITTRAEVLKKRAEHPTKWLQIVEQQKRLYQAIFVMNNNALAHDLNNAEGIAKRTVKAKSNFGPMAFSMLNQGLKTLMEIERNALLITPKNQEEVLATPEKEFKDHTIEVTLEEPTVHIMGFGKEVPENVLTETLAKWYDQAALPAPEPKKPDAVLPPEDPLDEEDEEDEL